MTMRVNPEMITIARESRSLNQSDLARKIQVTQGKISKYESGLLEVSPADLTRIAKILDYTEDFFSQTDSVFGIGPFVYYRSRKSLSSGHRKAIEAYANILRIQVARLHRAIDVESPYQFPSLDVDAFAGGPEEIARKVREYWCVRSGPIRNVVALIEGAGGIVYRVPFGTRLADATIQCPSGYPPLFLINGDVAVGDRVRFTLAHEIGHVVMRNSMSPNAEDEANRFASEFLMPAVEIGPQLDDLTIPKAIRLKPYWRVSLRALVRRASDIGKIPPRKYRFLNSELNRLGYATEEPERIPVEEPSMIKDIINFHINNLKYSHDNLAKLTFFTSSVQFRSCFLPGQSPNTNLKIVG